MNKKINSLITIVASIFITLISVFIVVQAQSFLYPTQLQVNGKGDIQQGLRINVLGATDALIIPTGNVGIGYGATSASDEPQAPLDVNGWARISGARINTLMVDNTLTLGSGGIDSGYPKFATSSSPANSFSVCIDSHPAVRYRISGGQAWLDIGGEGLVSGIITFNNNCSADGFMSTPKWDANKAAGSMFLAVSFSTGKCLSSALPYPLFWKIPVGPSAPADGTVFVDYHFDDDCYGAGGSHWYGVNYYTLENQPFTASYQ